jgi:hypothetical protein
MRRQITTSPASQQEQFGHSQEGSREHKQQGARKATCQSYSALQQAKFRIAALEASPQQDPQALSRRTRMAEA